MTYIVAALNITPDSFSGDGELKNTTEKAKKLIEDGADIIDIGAESTRPGATPLSAEEEWQRLERTLPEIINLAHKNNVKASIDTRHHQTASKAITMGVDFINDVEGFHSEEMINVVRQSEASLIMMHSLTVPADRDVTIPEDKDIIPEITKWAENTKQKLLNAGIKQERIIFDPGIGFGKTADQSWYLIKNIQQFFSLNLDILVGHSRKSFLNKITALPFAKRDIESLAISIYCLQKGVKYIRVHDVAIHKRAFSTIGELDVCS
ncbi:dihydropteroate synthase [Rickettsiales bacterium]|nr:dihydropteroate synthase [Rickettsiales bacterium]